jgi:hypothetical protein
MAIARPEVRFTLAEKELLRLLSELLVSQTAHLGANYTENEVALSDREAARLIELLEELLSSKKFLEGCFFAEEITKGSRADIGRLRNIFTEWRNRSGRAKSMSWIHWNEFLMRFNLVTMPSHERLLPNRKQMEFDYFLKMERILLQNSGVAPQVTGLVLRMISKRSDYIEEARQGHREIKANTISSEIKRLVEEMKIDGHARLSVGSISAQRAAGLLTIVADSAAMFTTRDWGVAGTLSTMAGAFAITVKTDLKN